MRRSTKYIHKTCAFQRQVGFDESGRPVIYSNFRQAATHRYSAEDSITHVSYIIENAILTMNPGISTWVFVVDCSGMYVDFSVVQRTVVFILKCLILFVIKTL